MMYRAYYKTAEAAAASAARINEAYGDDVAKPCQDVNRLHRVALRGDAATDAYDAYRGGYRWNRRPKGSTSA